MKNERKKYIDILKTTKRSVQEKRDTSLMDCHLYSSVTIMNDHFIIVRHLSIDTSFIQEKRKKTKEVMNFLHSVKRHWNVKEKD